MKQKCPDVNAVTSYGFIVLK